ncbi:MAG: DUF3570 domain-containing protein [Sandaracinaceae bacterium]|nr:DUF3570 domain-containing protein [Sandaracinaceae bacterium]
MAAPAATRASAWALVGLLTFASAAAAAQADEPTFEYAGYRFGLFNQRGRGLQSRAANDSAMPGSEDAWIFQSILDFQLRQDRNAVHNVAIPVDVVSAASTDALDAVATASRETESVDVDYLLTLRDTEHTTYQLRMRPHLEEHWHAESLGGAILHSFADDNAVLRVGAELTLDSFDKIGPAGFHSGPWVHRFAATFHAGISQLLSPTTMVSALYQFTAQFGFLETTYNSVPYEQGGRIEELLPRTRGRHSISGELRQAILETGTYLMLSYRFYGDSFQAYAHSAQATVTQELGDLWLRGHYRFHYQDAPEFWMAYAPVDLQLWEPRTADSDLETLYAQEIGLNARWFFERQGALTARSSFVQVGYLYYFRSNGLEMHLGTVEIGIGFQ